MLVVTHLFPTSVHPERGPWVAEQVDELQHSANITVLACAPGASDPLRTRDSGVRVECRDTATILGSRRIGLIGSTARYLAALNRYVRLNRGAFDVVHAHFGFPDAFVASRVARRRRIPLVVTLHGDDALRVAPRRDLIGLVVRAGIRRARVVICVSDVMAEVTRTIFPHADVRTITNGYNASLFRIGDVPRDLDVLFVGLLVPVKNVDVLLRAMARLQERASASLTIAGDGPLRTTLEKLATELGLSERVTFLGYRTRTEIASLMRRAKVLALPSSSEGYPLVIAEALACGTPVVASRVGGIPEIVVSPDAGALIAPNDTRELADALFAQLDRRSSPEAVAAGSAAQPWSTQVQPIATVYCSVSAHSRGQNSTEQ